MNHVSIFEKKWLDLVFEGKNKAYGAYQLRRENPRTTMLALLFGLLLLASVVSIGILAARLSGKPLITEIVDNDPPVTLVDLSDPPPPTPPSTNVTPPVKPKDQPENTEQLRDIEIVHPTDAQNVVIVNEPVAPETPGTGTPGINPTPVTPSGGTPGTAPAPIPDTRAVPSAILDEMPEYPGGIKNFYKYVGDNFDKPEIDDVKTVTVIVMFVIEKDGSITDVRVARDPGYGMAKEATRVLKSMKTKWKPGVKNGQKVRTAYTLPITVNIN